LDRQLRQRTGFALKKLERVAEEVRVGWMHGVAVLLHRSQPFPSLNFPELLRIDQHREPAPLTGQGDA
jgi:hypothetical protein